VRIKIGWVVMRHGDLVRTGTTYRPTSKVYRTVGAARGVATKRNAIVMEAFVEVEPLEHHCTCGHHKDDQCAKCKEYNT
jgi:hypothetical protein